MQWISNTMSEKPRLGFMQRVTMDKSDLLSKLETRYLSEWADNYEASLDRKDANIAEILHKQRVNADEQRRNFETVTLMVDRIARRLENVENVSARSLSPETPLGTMRV
mmetsp:Transcript_42846/g.71259  ORF Transcript_42846/g.71259 Transcript_42846/m.71259 type:complete len:109 (+) Transcript_42846:1-327(+)